MNNVNAESHSQTSRSLGIFRAVRTRNFLSMDRHEQEFFAVNEIADDVPVMSIRFGDGVWMVVEPSDLWWYDD
jgi:hypothetical protein